MKLEENYLKFVRWSDEDSVYVGYCPELFPWGGVCHAAREEDAYRQLCALVHDEIAELSEEGAPPPESRTRAMRDALMA